MFDRSRKGGNVPSDENEEITPGPAQEPAAGRLRRPALRIVVVGLIIAVLAVGLAISQWQLSDQRSLNRARSSAVAAAKTYAIEVASYDYQHLKSDFGAVETHSTPSFRKTFKSSSNALTKVLGQYHATAKATIIAVGVDSITSSRAVVLLFVNQTVTNTAQKSGPTKDNSRIKMTLDRSGSTWLIDQVELL
jgi:Mce-associated membrane protein